MDGWIADNDMFTYLMSIICYFNRSLLNSCPSMPKWRMIYSVSCLVGRWTRSIISNSKFGNRKSVTWGANSWWRVSRSFFFHLNKKIELIFLHVLMLIWVISCHGSGCHHLTMFSSKKKKLYATGLSGADNPARWISNAPVDPQWCLIRRLIQWLSISTRK